MRRERVHDRRTREQQDLRRRPDGNAFAIVAHLLVDVCGPIHLRDELAALGTESYAKLVQQGRAA
jgi:hypothetical protein